MKTGIELIAEERQEQIEKHNWTKDHDIEVHEDGGLQIAALYAATLNDDYHQPEFSDFEEHVSKKDYLQRQIIAGALLAAEIDRLRLQNLL
jgi:hypothetical protein